MIIKNKSFEGTNRKNLQQDSPSAIPIRLINLKFKSAQKSLHQSFPSQFYKEFSNIIEQDNQGRVSAEVLLSKLLPSSLILYKKVAERQLCRLLKTQNATDIKINLKDLLALFFYDRRSEKTLNFLENCWKIEIKANISPDQHLFNCFSTSFRVKHSSRQFHYPHTMQNKSQDYLKLVLAWWNEISDGKNRILAKSITEFLFNKGFSSNFDECIEFAESEWQEFWDFEEFLALFIFPIIKSVLMEEEKKNSLQKKSKSFLPSYQKIKAQKQRMKFSCFSPLPIKLGYVESKNFRLKRMLALNEFK